MGELRGCIGDHQPNAPTRVGVGGVCYHRTVRPRREVERQPMMQYVEAPDEYDGPGPSLFLAGGITGTFNWQDDVVARLAELPLVILNPRRKNFPMNDPAAAEAQIGWEFRHIRRATAVLFWFPPETLCPIALFELGGRTMAPQPLFV